MEAADRARRRFGQDAVLPATLASFAGSAPTTPVWTGELSAPNLGVALAAYDGAGRPVTDQVGELVVTRPMPSMPLYFWNDAAAAATATPVSPPSRACGGTATGSPSPPTGR